MKLTAKRDEATRSITCTLTMTDMDRHRAKLQQWDWQLFDECEKSNKVSDKLLGLECWARRIEEGSE